MIFAQYIIIIIIIIIISSSSSSSNSIENITMIAVILYGS